MSVGVVAFEEPAAGELANAGGKAARLAQMAVAGLPVPPGFVVCAGAWRAFLAAEVRHSRMASALAGLGQHAGPDELAEAAQRLRDLVIDAPLPAALEDAVAAAYRRLADRLGVADPPVAVRSSATLEDAAAESFAGQYETFLWLSGVDAITTAIQRCWAGQFSASSLAYAAHRGFTVLDGAMAVAVQSMVEARTAGVMFTLDPATGDPSVVSIEASWGLGSAVVGGEVTPDSYVVAKPSMSIRERRLHTKHIRHVADSDVSGVRVEQVPEDLRDRPCLGDEEVLELAALGRRVERLYGAPQDIEWGIDDRLPFPDCVLLLQARPETAWSRRRSEPVLDPGAGALGWIAQTLRKGA
jgi:pyruvate, water dikinase